MRTANTYFGFEICQFIDFTGERNDYCNNLEGRNKIGESKGSEETNRLTPGVKSGQLAFDLC